MIFLLRFLFNFRPSTGRALPDKIHPTTALDQIGLVSSNGGCRFAPYRAPPE